MNSLSRMRKIMGSPYSPHIAESRRVVLVSQLQFRDTFGTRLLLFVWDKDLFPAPSKKKKKKHRDSLGLILGRRGMPRTRTRTNRKKVIGAKRL